MIRGFFLLGLVFLLAACSSETDNSEPPAELVDFEASAQVEKLWDVSIGDGVGQQYLRLYPLLLEDRLVVADRSGVIRALDLEEGDELWEIELDVVITGGVGGDAQNHIVTTRDGEAINVDGSGKIKWRREVSSEVLVPAVKADDRVIIRSVDGQIKALSVEDGEQLWSYKRDVPSLSLRGNSMPVVDRGRVYNGLDNGRLVILALADGRVLFDVAVAVPSGRSELERMVDIDGDAVLQQNVLYIASYQGRVVAIDVRRGQLIWTRNLSTSTGVEVTDGSLFSSDDRDYVWALDKSNGATLWKQDKLRARQLTRPVAMGESVVVGDYDGYLHWLSQYDGHFIARTQVDGAGILVPPLVKQDRLYVISREGELAAYRFQAD